MANSKFTLDTIPLASRGFADIQWAGELLEKYAKEGTPALATWMETEVRDGKNVHFLSIIRRVE